MSLLTSLYSGATGLAAASHELSVVGDNIANAGTIGFKGSRAAFEDALAQSLIGAGTGNGQIGIGVKLRAVQKILTQGALTNTGLATDLALQGGGMFVVSGSHDGRAGSFYTRAGQFTIDRNGYLVNLEGLRVQGYAADATGALGSALGDLQAGNAASSPLATANVTVKANLDANATVPAAWNVAQAAATSNFSTSVTAYDSLGKAHQVDIYFRRTAAGAWEWHAVTDGGGLTGGTAGTPTEVANGTMTFDTSGKLSAVTTTSTNFNPVGAVNPQALTFNFGDPTGSGGTGLLGITQFASPSATTFLSQDGYAAGELASIGVDAEGRVVGAFTNGQTRTLGQVAVADFEAPDRLARVGGNLYARTSDSGEPTVGAPGSGGRGAITAGALEQSNVDLAGEFIRMITAQRGFQANAKTITTADQLLAELMAIKR